MPKLKPNYGVLDSRFVYVPANKTDIRKLFDQVRARLAEEEAKRKAQTFADEQEVQRAEDERIVKVRSIKRI